MVTPTMLDALLRPRSVAVVGASERSVFSALLVANLDDAGHRARTHLVNARRREVHARPTVARCRDVVGGVDLAVVMVPAEHVPDVLRDAAAAGARAAVVLSSGYAETGAGGRARQDALAALGAELGIAVLGPNVLGLVDVAAGMPVIALADPPRTPGPVALISQSGASCGAMKEYAALAGVGLSHVVTVGNEAMVTVGHLVEHLVDDDAVRAIAVFVESIREPARFAAAARRARDAGTCLVVLKVGRSELAARAAASHTGALVGDDRVVEAMFDDLGVVRVDTIEDMLVTAGVAAHTGPLARPGLGVVSISGGACDLVADLADAAGLPLPELGPTAAAAVAARLPAFGHAHNPLDLTGAAVADPTLWTEAVAAVGDDPAVGAVLAVNSLPWREDGAPFHGARHVDAIGAGAARASAPVLYVTQTTQPVGAQARRLLEHAGLRHVVPGLRGAVEGVARVAEWSRRRHRVPDREPPGERRPGPALPAVTPGPVPETVARRLLEAAGVPVVPARHVRSAAEAGTAARDLADRHGGPLVLKVVSAGIAHKTDVGGVRLGVHPADAARTYDAIIAACAAAVPDAELDGVLVSPQRPPATELLVGVTRDPDWGLVLAVGLGGVLAEVLDDVALAPVPLDAARAGELLGRLRGRALLDGVRGRPPADLAAVAAAVVGVGRLAAALDARHGDRLDAVEVNPLRVAGDRVEALDALVTWRPAPHPEEVRT